MTRARALLKLAFVAASGAVAAASKSPVGSALAAAGASKAVLGRAVAPVVVSATHGRGQPSRWLLRYGALAAFAGAGILLSMAPNLDGDDDDDDDYGENINRDFLGGYDSTRRPSAHEIRQLTRMLKRVHRQMKKKLEVQKESQEHCWQYIEDQIKKGRIIHSAIGLIIDFQELASKMAISLVTLVEKYGDPVQSFVCPYSGFSEMICVINVKAKCGNNTGGGGNTALERFTESMIASKMARSSVAFIAKYGDPVIYFICPYSGFAEILCMTNVTPKSVNGTGGNPALERSTTQRMVASNRASSSVSFIEKNGGPVQWFVCPYSGFAEILCITNVTPKSVNGTGGNPALERSTTQRMNTISHFPRMEIIGVFSLWQEPVDRPDMVRCQMNFKIYINGTRKKATLIKALEEADVKSTCVSNSWGKKLQKKPTLIKALEEAGGRTVYLARSRLSRRAG